MGKTIISKKVIKLGDWVRFPIEHWRLVSGWTNGINSWNGSEEMVQALGKIVRVQTNGMFNYDIEYRGYDNKIAVCTKVRSEITTMDRDAARLWRLLYD